MTQKHIGRKIHKNKSMDKLNMKCGSCEYFKEIPSTAKEPIHGVCTFSNEYAVTNSEANCIYEPVGNFYKFHCKDCSHFLNDPGCMTCKEDDSIFFTDNRGTVHICSGFYPYKDIEILIPILIKWLQTGLEVEELLNNLLTDTKKYIDKINKR